MTGVLWDAAAIVGIQCVAAATAFVARDALATIPTRRERT